MTGMPYFSTTSSNLFPFASIAFRIFTLATFWSSTHFLNAGTLTRIRLTNVAVTPDEDPSLVWIEIAYVRVADLRPDNLVYPFYLR